MSPREFRGVRRPNNSVGQPEKDLIVNGIGSRNRTLYLETNWEIAQFQVSPASEVRLRK